MKFLIAALLLISSTAFAGAEVGKAAPDFSVTGQDGKTYKLSDFKGQNLVLEWYNKDCPFVRKHYDSKNMQDTQKKITGDISAATKTTWLTVISSVKGKQGYLTAKEAAAQMKKEGMGSQAILLDSTGAMGKAYGAVTTPHMFVINSQGNVVYTGAIDSISTSKTADVEKATNYILSAMTDLNAGKAITTATTKPYGCGVKY